MNSRPAGCGGAGVSGEAGLILWQAQRHSGAMTMRLALRMAWTLFIGTHLARYLTVTALLLVRGSRFRRHFRSCAQLIRAAYGDLIAWTQVAEDLDQVLSVFAHRRPPFDVNPFRHPVANPNHKGALGCRRN